MLHDPLHVQISQVLSLCCAIPASLLPYQNSGLVYFLLILPRTTICLLTLLSAETWRQ
jgi:hypothetical protein